MELSSWIYIAVFVIVVILIFKFIKKVVYAIISVIVLVLLIIGGIGFLIYTDINNLTSQNDYDVKIIYSKSESYFFGVNVPIENQSFEVEKLESLSQTELKNIDVKSIDGNDNQFVIIVDEKTFSDLLVEEEYDLKELPGVDMSSFKDYNLKLTKEEILSIVNSEDGTEKLAEILLEKNKDLGISKSLLEEMINSGLEVRGISLNEALFLFIVSTSFENEEAVVNLLENYKEDELQVYPERISFKFVKILPVNTIKSFLYENNQNLSEE